MLSRRTILTGLAGAPIAWAVSNVAPFVSPAPAATPASAPSRGQRMIGAAIRPDQVENASPLRDAIQRCDLIVPEFHGQWSAVEWRRGEPWYGNYDAIVDFAARHGQSVRGHALIWEQMTPDWAKKELHTRKDWRTVERHFANLLPRYRGKIGEWIVVNEMIDTEDGDRNMRRTSFQRAFGNEYVARALETARQLDPDARLMINEYALYHDNPVDEARRTALLKLVETLKRDNVPLDSVGIQGHLELAKGAIPERRFAGFLADLAAMGVDISLTELDVLEADRSEPVARRDARVASLVQSLLAVAADQPAVTSLVTWGLSDKDSWLQDRQQATKVAAAASPVDDRRINRGLPFDANMKPKPMYLALQTLRRS